MSNTADIRVAQLAVSIFQVRLQDHFADLEKLKLATLYHTGKPDLTRKFRHGLDLDELLEFFGYLYKTNVELFRQILEYLLNDWHMYEHNPLSDEPARMQYVLYHINAIGFDYKDRKLLSTLGHDKPRVEMMSELERMLNEIKPDFLKMFRGSWEALLSNNPDRYRQAISSMRELLRQVIDELSGTKGDETRKERVKLILGRDSDAELVEALAKTVDAIYKFRSSREHTQSNYESAIFVISEAEYVLYYILKRYSSLKH